MTSLRLVPTHERLSVAARAGVAARGQATRARQGQTLPGTSYRIVRWIGEGGMGVVYEAEHVDLGRRVALKVLRPEFSGDESATHRFASEARAVCQLASPYIVQVFDFARLPDGRGVFTMEMLGGRTLLTEVDAGPVDPARAIGLLRQVCKALASAHDAGIIHRDVKPDNIAIVGDTRTRDTVRLLDFGIHAIVNPSEGTAEANPAGSPSYLAPEAIVGVPIGVAADIYSLGCVAFEMLAGRLPFEHERESDRLLAHLDEAPPRLHEVSSDVPLALASVIDRCLEKAPGDRWTDARDLEAALCEAQISAGLATDWDDLPVPDVEPGRRDTLLRGMPDPMVVPVSRRSRVLVVLAVVAMLLIAAALWPRVDPAEVDAVERLVVLARSAAARAYFVYPPPDQPSLATAYRRVLELEQRDDPGPERAAVLRREFAETLARQGDRYWDEPGGMPFAIDYYAEAIVFVPDHRRASLRAALTFGQVSAMAQKAATLGFTEFELIAAEPLVVLAEADEELRNRGLARLRDDGGGRRAASTASSLDRLAEAIDPLVERPGALQGKPVTDPLATDLPAAMGSRSVQPRAAAVVVAAAVVDADVEAEPPVPLPSKTQGASERVASRAVSRRLAKEAVTAFSRGRYSEAERLYEAAISEDPRNAGAHAGLASIYFERGDYAAAARRGRRAVRLAPGNATYQFRLGDACYKTFRYGEALKHYEAAQRLGFAGAKRSVEKARAKL